MKKFILILTLFFISSYAQTDTLSFTATEIDSGLTRALVSYNKTVWFTSEGNTLNSGLNINDAKATLQQALDKAFALVPSTSNRIAVVGLEYANDATNYTIPDYISVIVPHSTYSGSITLGTASQFTDYDDFTSGGVTSVFSRTGVVVAASNDYTIAQIQYATDSLNTRVKYSDSLTTFVTPTQLADSAFLQSADIASKVNYSDSLTTFATPTQIADSAFLQASDITGKVNYSDSLTTFTTPTQIADSAFLQSSDITGKVNYSDSLTTFTTPNQIADSAFLQATDIVGKVNYSDSLTTFVTPTQLADSLTFGTWKVFYSDATGKLNEVALGTDGQVLTSTGAGTIPAFETPSSGFSDPMTTRGDIIYRDATNTTTRLAVGTATHVLQSDGTDISYQALTSSDISDLSTNTVTSIDTVGGSGATGDIFIKAGSNITVSRVADTLTITSTASGGASYIDTLVYKAADESVTSSTTLQDDDHLIVDLVLGNKYMIKYELIAEGNTAGDWKGQVLASGGLTFNTVTQMNVSPEVGATDPNVAYSITSQVQSGAGVWTDTWRVPIRMWVYADISASGQLKLQWAQDVSNGTATTLKAGSIVTVYKLN